MWLRIQLLLAITLSSFTFAQLEWSIRPTTTTSDSLPIEREEGLMGIDTATQDLYIFGGKTIEGTILNDAWVFSNGEWRELATNSATRPSPRFSTNGGVVSVGSSLYFIVMIGDLGGGVRSSDVWALSIESEEWTLLTPTSDSTIPDRRYGAAGGPVPGTSTLRLSHGFDKLRYSDSYILDVSSAASDGTCTWTLIHPEVPEYSPFSPHARCLGTGAALNDGNLVMYGGCLSGGGVGGPCPSNDGWILDESTASWTEVDRAPPATIYASMYQVPSLASSDLQTVVMYGGRQTSTQVLATREIPDDVIHVLQITGDNSATWYSVKTTSGSTDASVIPGRREKAMIVAAIGTDGVQTVYMYGGEIIRTGEFDGAIYQLRGDFSSISTSTGEDSYPWFTLWMLHGILMFISWGVMLQAGALIARYVRYRDPFWFKAHRALQSMGLVISIIGVILGFISANTIAPRHLTFPHSIIGVVITVIGILQPLNAFFRPHPGDKGRFLWSLFHKNLGRIALILALANITIGLLMALAVDGLWISWLVLLGIFVLFYIYLEVRLRRGKNGTVDREAGGAEDAATEQQNDNIGTPKGSPKNAQFNEANE